MERKIYKKIAKNGSLTLPRLVREQLGMYPHTGISIDIIDGKVVIDKSAPGCILCGNTDDLIKRGSHNVCRHCVSELSKEV